MVFSVKISDNYDDDYPQDKHVSIDILCNDDTDAIMILEEMNRVLRRCDYTFGYRVNKGDLKYGTN